MITSITHSAIKDSMFMEHLVWLVTRDDDFLALYADAAFLAAAFCRYFSCPFFQRPVSRSRGQK